MTADDLGTPDAVLVAEARGGSESAFSQLVRRHQGAVGRVVIRMLGPGDDADDAAQQTFIRFHDALEQFRGDAAVATYLSRIAMNVSLNILRRRRWTLRRFVRRDAGEVSPAEEPTREERDRAVAGERRAAIERALGRLSDAHRAVVVCRLLEELSTAETAAVLEIPEGTVMSRLTRALAKLRVDLMSMGLEGS